ncbi:MAG: glucosamine-6-phosphate deaminase [Myxococcota bacterium]
MASRLHEQLRPVVQVDEREAVDRALASEIARLIHARRAEGRPCVLGLATGHTPTGVYRELVRLHRDEGLSFADVITFNLDEYAGLSPEHPASFRAWMQRVLFERVDVDPGATHVPRGDAPDPEAECRRYEALLREAGGVDLQVLGLGRNGHVGFNEPGSPVDSRTRVVTLAETTRRVNARDFPDDTPVPDRALTMGVETILEARRLRVIAFGEHKADAVRHLVESEPEPAWPCSLLRGHDDLRVLCDAPAASLLSGEDAA